MKRQWQNVSHAGFCKGSISIDIHIFLPFPSSSTKKILRNSQFFLQEDKWKLKDVRNSVGSWWRQTIMHQMISSRTHLLSLSLSTFKKISQWREYSNCSGGSHLVLFVLVLMLQQHFTVRCKVSGVEERPNQFCCEFHLWWRWGLEDFYEMGSCCEIFQASAEYLLPCRFCTWKSCSTDTF